MISVYDSVSLFFSLLIQTLIYLGVRQKFWPASSTDACLNTVERKKRAWLLSTVVSGLYSLFVVPYAVTPGIFAIVDSPTSFNDLIFSETHFHRSLVLYFLAFLWLDMLIGYLDYPEHLRVDTTWIHHIVSTLYLYAFLEFRLCFVFLLCSPLEVPTFILSLGSVLPSFRNDLAFGVTFLAFRIIYEGALFLYLYFNCPYIPLWLLFSAGVPTLAFHCFWFYKWTLGFLKKTQVGSEIVGATPRIRGISSTALDIGKEVGDGDAEKVHPPPDPKIPQAGAGASPEVVKTVRSPPARIKERQA